MRHTQLHDLAVAVVRQAVVDLSANVHRVELRSARDEAHAFWMQDGDWKTMRDFWLVSAGLDPDWFTAGVRKKIKENSPLILEDAA